MEKRMYKQTNNTIDFFKAMACIGVVLIHCRFPGAFGALMRTIARFAVPFFTMISGFYLLNNEVERVDTVRLKRKIKHMLKLIVGAELFAFTFFVFGDLISKHTLNFVILKYTDVARWIKLVWDNTPLSYTHFWYLYALLYCYIAVLFMKKVKIRMGGGKTVIISAVVLFGAFYSMSAISNTDLPFHFMISIGREDNISALYNLFLFRSEPFFLIGIAIRIYEQKIKNSELLSKRNLMICMIVGVLLSILERLILGDVQIFIGTSLMVLTIFSYCIKYPDGINGQVEKIGKNLSMYVYIIHVSVMEVVNWLGKVIGICDFAVFQWIRPVIVITVSLLCATLLYEFRTKKQKKPVVI